MKKILASLVTASLLALPALAEPKIEKWRTYDSLGCMILKECTEGVFRITSVEDFKEFFPSVDYSGIEEEFDALIKELTRIGVGVYAGEEKYFPRNHRGVYTTVGNDFFLNINYLWDVKTTLEVTRHEGWHAVQDCMAGTIENTQIAIVHHDGIVPNEYTLRANVIYGPVNPHVVPWEAEALWAAEDPYQTVNALKACQHDGGEIWDIYEPTPMTREWLVKNGFLDGDL